MSQSREVAITRFDGGTACDTLDCVALEEPLEIRLDATDGTTRGTRSLSITMRTPGHDRELAAGFLFTEGLVRQANDLTSITQDSDHVVTIHLADHARVAWPTIERHFYATSSCGVCGKASLDALNVPGLTRVVRDGFTMDVRTLPHLSSALRAQQSVFDRTGGLHAAALFNEHGDLVALREDVGRHNAVDKLLGAQFLQGCTPLSERLLFLSGRASFELVQKALAAGIPMIAAVGAPSSLAVELAQQFDISLVGFVRDNRCNAYSGTWRLRGDTP
jgi:FdhD protein